MDISKKTRYFTEDETGGAETLQLSYRSNPGANIDTGTLCITETTDFLFYIYSSTQPIVSTGDIAYNTNNLSSPFDGLDKFYKVAFAPNIDTDEYIVQIDSVGVMTVQESCSI